MALILGTAGHIDHGKTSLVRALTGIDCDRLEEEKRRGITIELGFAWVPMPGGERLGIVDVPGSVEVALRGDTMFLLNFQERPISLRFQRTVTDRLTGEVLTGETTLPAFGVMALAL